MLLLCRTNH
jgi:hypothetical protein